MSIRHLYILNTNILPQNIAAHSDINHFN